jgi:cell division initiation protein
MRIDLPGKSIPRALFGYDRTRVDRLMEDLSDALARVTEEKLALGAKARELEIRLAESAARETELLLSLERAQERAKEASGAGEELREAARKEARLTVEAARIKADSLLQNAAARLTKIMEEAAAAQKSKTLFELRLRALNEDHLRLLDLGRQESAGLDAAVRRLDGALRGPANAPLKEADA